MTRHFGVLIPSTNTTVEVECRLLPATYQAHVGRLMTSAPGRTFSPSRDEDIDYQSRLLGTARVEMVILAQTSASLFADDYDEVTTRRMSAGAGVPAITSAQAVGRAVRALGARRIAVVSPYSDEVNQRAGRYFAAKHGIEAIALEGFGATDSYAIGQLGLAQIGKNPAFFNYGVHHETEARRQITCVTAEIDTNGDGVGDQFINLGSSYTLFG